MAASPEPAGAEAALPSVPDELPAADGAASDPALLSESDPAVAGAPGSLAALTPLDERSFFAQPEPLKWTAAATTALRMGPPPQRSHASGPGACTPCTTSTRAPQLAHM